MNEVKIKIITADGKYQRQEAIRVEVNNELVATGEFGGEPEDACESRDYSWVKDALKFLAIKLGAERIIVSKEEVVDEAYNETAFGLKCKE